MNNSTLWARHLTVLTLAFGTLTTIPARADNDTLTTPELLVTTGATPLPTKEVAGSFTVITAKDIKRFQYRSLVDALKQVPGLSVVQQGVAGTVTSVFTRGSNSNQTLVLLNGQPINDPSSPSGAFNFATLMLDNVDRIEVVRGPQSALYGSQAIGGVVNIITNQQVGKTQTTLRVEAGTLGTLNTSASTAGNAEGVSYFASLNRQATNGADITPPRNRFGAPEEKDGFENVSGSLQLNGKLSDTLRASGFVQFGSARGDTDDDTPGAGLGSQSHTKQLSLQGSVDGTFMDGRYMPSVTVAYNQYKRYDYDTPDAYSTTDSLSNNRGESISISADNSYQVNDWNLASLGFKYSHEKFETNGYYLSTFFNSLSNSEASTSTTSVYGSDHIELADNFFVTVSGRFDMPQAFQNQFTYSIAPTYEITQTNTRLIASYGTGFKVPALYERFGSSASTFGPYIGNPNLTAEKSHGWEAGFEQSLFSDAAKFGVTYFRNRIEDSINTVYPGAYSTSLNGAPYTAFGFESFVEINPFENVSARADYTYLGLDLEPGSKPLYRRPRHTANGTIAWQATDRLSLGTTFQWVGSFTDVANVAPFYGPTRPYAVVNLASSFQVTNHIELSAKINNLLNRSYEPTYGYQAPGIEALAGIAVTF